MAQNDTSAHREKREKAVDAEIVARKRGKMQQAEHALELQQRRNLHDDYEHDWMGIGANAAQMRVFTEDAVDDLEEQQFRNADERQQRLRYQQEQNARIWRRQDRLANQRRNVQAALVQRLGRQPTMDEFIAAITNMKDDENSWDVD